MELVNNYLGKYLFWMVLSHHCNSIFEKELPKSIDLFDICVSLSAWANSFCSIIGIGLCSLDCFECYRFVFFNQDIGYSCCTSPFGRSWCCYILITYHWGRHIFKDLRIILAYLEKCTYLIKGGKGVLRPTRRPCCCFVVILGPGLDKQKSLKYLLHYCHDLVVWVIPPNCLKWARMSRQLFREHVGISHSQSSSHPALRADRFCTSSCKQTERLFSLDNDAQISKSSLPAPPTTAGQIKSHRHQASNSGYNYSRSQNPSPFHKSLPTQTQTPSTTLLPYSFSKPLQIGVQLQDFAPHMEFALIRFVNWLLQVLSWNLTNNPMIILFFNLVKVLTQTCSHPASHPPLRSQCTEAIDAVPTELQCYSIFFIVPKKNRRMVQHIGSKTPHQFHNISPVQDGVPEINRGGSVNQDFSFFHRPEKGLPSCTYPSTFVLHLWGKALPLQGLTFYLLSNFLASFMPRSSQGGLHHTHEYIETRKCINIQSETIKTLEMN